MPNKLWMQLYSLGTPLKKTKVFDKETFNRLEIFAYEKGYRLYGYGCTENFSLCKINGIVNYKLSTLKSVENKIKKIVTIKNITSI